MKLIINKNQIDNTPKQFLRRAGYGYIRDRKTGQDSFVRRLGSNFYPRLHMYVKEQGDKIIFNLHLDQKQASYAGAHAHNAEYDGEMVAEEIERLKQLTIKNYELKIDDKKTVDPQNMIGQGRLPRDTEEPKKISWWRRLFS